MPKKNSPQTSANGSTANKSQYEMVEAFKGAVASFERKHMSTPAKALATLKREGILRQDGKLAKSYGGE